MTMSGLQQIILGYLLPWDLPHSHDDCSNQENDDADHHHHHDYGDEFSTETNDLSYLNVVKLCDLFYTTVFVNLSF